MKTLNEIDHPLAKELGDWLVEYFNYFKLEIGGACLNRKMAQLVERIQELERRQAIEKDHLDKLAELLRGQDQLGVHMDIKSAYLHLREVSLSLVLAMQEADK